MFCIQINCNRIRFEALSAVVMNVAAFSHIDPCTPYASHRFGGTYHFHVQDRETAKQETNLLASG
jgi:hypothetical protein